MKLLEAANVRDKVKRNIVDPLKGRGAPPRGWTEEAMFADYVLALGGYSETVLAEAGAKIRAEHTRSTWPLAGEFREACEKLGGAPEKPRSHSPESERVRVSVAAYAYVTKRMQAADGALLHRAIVGGWQRECRAWLFDWACADIRAGNDPHVPNENLEAPIGEWEIDVAARRQSQAAVGAPKGRPLSDVQRAVAQPAPMLEEPAPRAPVDLDEEIPPPASEDDYGVSASAD